MPNDPIRAAIRAGQGAKMRRLGFAPPDAAPEDAAPTMPRVSAGTGSGDRPAQEPADLDTILRLIVGMKRL